MMNITAQDALLVNSILYMFGFIIVLFIVFKYKNKLFGLSTFSYYFLFSSIGTFLMYFRETGPQFLTIVVANYLVLLAAMFMITGISNFYNKKIPYKVFIIISIITLISMTYFTFMDFSFPVRTLIFGVFAILLHFHSLLILYKNRIENEGEIELLSVMIIIFIYCMLARNKREKLKNMN